MYCKINTKILKILVDRGSADSEVLEELYVDKKREPVGKGDLMTVMERFRNFAVSSVKKQMVAI